MPRPIAMYVGKIFTSESLMPTKRIAAVLMAAIITMIPVTAIAQDEEPVFGGPSDVSFAERLWGSLKDARLVGARSIIAQPYEGSEPHGTILMTLDTDVEVDGREDTVIVKKNYGGENISIESVATNPNLFLGAITVMFRREEGYDPQTQNWFWAKYSPDGSLQTNPAGAALAGRISRNPEDGCIACHQFAPGDDFVFLHDRFAPLDLATTSVASEQTGDTVTGLAALPVQPTSGDLDQGLGVTYYRRIFNLVGEVSAFASANPGTQGAPITVLDYKSGSAEVLTSGSADAVGAEIRGVINFTEAGVYTLALESNDGVELSIGAKLIVSDPGVHADRFSPLVPVEITEPGWYPFEMTYFEKRSTATLRLYWLPPGEAGGLKFVPAEALAHLRE